MFLGFPRQSPKLARTHSRHASSVPVHHRGGGRYSHLRAVISNSLISLLRSRRCSFLTVIGCLPGSAAFNAAAVFVESYKRFGSPAVRTAAIRVCIGQWFVILFVFVDRQKQGASPPTLLAILRLGEVAYLVVSDYSWFVHCFVSGVGAQQALTRPAASLAHCSAPRPSLASPSVFFSWYPSSSPQRLRPRP